MKRTLFVVILFIFLNGCASRENLEWNLSAWVGHNVNGLIQHWGTPTDVSDLSNGSALYSWLFDEGLANTPIKGTINTVSQYCKITIGVSTNDLVQSWQLEGNNCKV